jgi:LuxR family maltose regulon positive regulatory protein
LRGQDALLELRATDLQFTPQETSTFLVEVMELPLSTEESALLHTHTEGWIAGLHLAVLSLLNHEDRATSIATFSGSHHYVVDYLLEEVLSRQGQDIQGFLMQTSILDMLSGPLCDAVRAQDGSQGLLASLERANLFLVSLDDERHWYRYHHLFAQVLRQHLQQTAPQLMQQLHLRASNWYEQHGFFAEAVSHALAALAFEEAAHLLEHHIGTFLSGSQLQTLSEWLKALPEPLTLAHPTLCLIHALVLMYTNHLEAAAAWLQMLERERQFRGQVLAGWGLLARLSGDLERCVVFSRQALELLPETETAPLTQLLRIEAILGAAHTYLVSGDVTPTNERRLTEFLAFTYTFKDYRLLTARGLNLLARLQELQGQLLKVATTYEEVVQLIPSPEALLVPANGVAYYFGQGELLYEWNELEASEHALAQGMALIRGPVLVDADQVWLGYATLARLQMARGAYDLALATLNTFRQLAQQRRLAPVLLARCTALHAQIHLVRGELKAAREWVERNGPSVTDVPNYLHEQEYLTMARIRIAEERINPTKSGLAEVLAMLELLRVQAEMSMRVRSKLEVLLLLALVREKQGNYTGALTTLSEVLTLAEPEGYIRLFLDEGLPMLSLLRVAQRYGLAPEYIERLLKAADGRRVAYASEQSPRSDSLKEPLTAREYDVLRLLCEGMSNQEIADQLIVSVNTVKKHVRNICGKLNVQGRMQAIAKVQKLHLM